MFDTFLLGLQKVFTAYKICFNYIFNLGHRGWLIFMADKQTSFSTLIFATQKMFMVVICNLKLNEGWFYEIIQYL